MSVQKKIRDLERLLRKKSGDPEAAATIEEKIRGLKQEKTNNAQKERERKNSVKYHMVKFFERKKLTRKIRSVDSKIKKSESSKDTKKLNKEREHIKEDLAYVLYYPKSMKYVALFADSAAAEESEEDDDKTSAATAKKAREAALSAWRQSIETEGEIDKVEAAITVEYEKPLKGSSIRKGAKKLAGEDGDDDVAADSGSDSGAESSGSEGSNSDSGSDSSGPSDSEEEDRGEDEPMEKKKSSSDREPAKRSRDEAVPAERKKGKVEVAPKPASKPHPPEFVPDSFFMEEADEAEDGTVEIPAPSAYNDRSGRGRGGARGGRGSRGGAMAHRGSRPLSAAAAAASSGEFTKQESRLLAWQSGARGRRGGRGSGRGAAASSDNRATDGGIKNTPSTARPKPTGAPPRGGRGDRRPQDKRGDSATTGGAGRAQHNGVAPRQFVSIDAQKPANKKIKFDE